MKNMQSIEVNQLVNQLNPPLKEGIEYLRQLILNSDLDLIETIKWNGPNYQYRNIDCITLRIQDLKQIQIIFHRGAKVKIQPKDHLIKDEFSLLEWKENDRAIISLKSNEEIMIKKSSIQVLINRWILASCD
jgi:hypothetical protein